MAIRTELLSKSFQNGRLTVDVLFDIDLQIAPGEFIAVMGPSGCGKSTLLHIIGLMLAPSSGKVYIRGTEVTELSARRQARLRSGQIGFVFQRFNLLPTVSAYQNIAIAERIRGNRPDGQIDRALEAVDMLAKASHKPAELSIGEQQRIAIARAISHRPAILLADEPTGNLDSKNAENILQLFRAINETTGMTILMITHSLTAGQFADRVVYLNDGRIQNV